MSTVYTIVRSIVRFIFHDWFAKILSFLAASLFYLYLQTSKVTIKDMEIPIEYPRLSSTFTYGKNNPKTVQVRVQGLKDLVNYHSQFLKVAIEQNDLRVGENIIEVKKYWGSSPKIKITPENETIAVYVDHTYAKSIPVEINFEGELPPGLIKTSHSIKPANITVNGTKEVIDGLSKLTLGKINLSQIKESTTISLKPSEPPKGTTFVGSPREFQIRVNVFRGNSSGGDQVFGGIPIRCEGRAENLIPVFSQEEVTIKFHSNSPVNSIDIIQGIRAVVPCTHTYDYKTKKIIPGPYPVTAKVKITKTAALRALEITSIVPEKITVQFRVKNRDSEDPRLQDDPAFDDIIWPDNREDSRTQ